MGIQQLVRPRAENRSTLNIIDDGQTLIEREVRLSTLMYVCMPQGTPGCKARGLWLISARSLTGSQGKQHRPGP